MLLCALGVQPHDVDAVIPHRRQEGQVVGLVHWVRPGEELLGLDVGDGEAVRIVRRGDGHGGQPPSAAGELRFAGGGQDIAAVRALIKFDALHIASVGWIGADPPAEQAVRAQPQRFGQRRDDGCIGHPGGALPFGHGLGADVDALSQRGLGESEFLPPLADELCDMLHGGHLLGTG